MSGIQGPRSNEISPLNRIKDKYLFFIIEIAGEPISRERKKPKIIRATTTSCDSELDFQDVGVEPAHSKSAANGSDVLIGCTDASSAEITQLSLIHI